jgi:hypothetical protein
MQGWFHRLGDGRIALLREAATGGGGRFGDRGAVFYMAWVAPRFGDAGVPSWRTFARQDLHALRERLDQRGRLAPAA